MILRKIGKTFLGESTPFHLVLSCLFGAWISFAAPFSQAPGYWVVLVSLILVLPVNLFLATLTGLVAYPIAVVLLPLSFHTGRLLLDGPTRPLFEWLVNTPFLALMGFEYYAHTGGLLLGGLVGAAAGLVVVRFVSRLRRKVVELDAGSEKFQTWSSKWQVRLLVWTLLGAKPDASKYAELEGKRIGKPVRTVGVVIAGVLVAAFFVLTYVLSGPILTRALRRGLEEANGATVDLDRAEISLGEGRVLIDALALADPKARDTDLLRGLRLEADIGMGELLTRRFKIDKVILVQASSGEKRTVPGKLTGTEPVAQDGGEPEGEEVKTIDDYIKDAKRWRERLAQVRRWIDMMGGQPDPEDEEEADAYRERLERWARELGYMKVAAEHLIQGAPRVTIGELRVEGLKAMQVDGKSFDIVGTNLSTHPHLLDGAPQLSIRSRDGTMVFDISLASVSRQGGTSSIEVVWKGLSGDTIGRQLEVAGTQPIHGGTIDIASKGTWGPRGIDLPLTIVLENTRLVLPGVGKAHRIDHLELPLRVFGPLDDPRILFRERDLKDALVAAGRAELADRLGGVIDKHVPGDLKKKAKGLLDRLKGDK